MHPNRCRPRNGSQPKLVWIGKALIKYIKANPTAIKNSAAVLADLAEFEAVFKGLHAQKIRWHFQVDF